MYTLTNKHITYATEADIDPVKYLLNDTYRGENSRQGWTTEADLIAGNIRADENMIKGVLEQTGSVILIYKDDEQNITGCVNLQKHAEKIYLGMFSVSPQMQGGGIGKQLLKAAEEYALAVNCMAIYMSVISIRTELIDWYNRHGYVDTGERKPFVEDGITGKHLQPLEFLVMEKLM